MYLRALSIKQTFKVAFPLNTVFLVTRQWCQNSLYRSNTARRGYISAATHQPSGRRCRFFSCSVHIFSVFVPSLQNIALPSCKSVCSIFDNTYPLLQLPQVMGRFNCFISWLRTTKSKVSLKSDVMLVFQGQLESNRNNLSHNIPTEAEPC